MLWNTVKKRTNFDGHGLWHLPKRGAAARHLSAQGTNVLCVCGHQGQNGTAAHRRTSAGDLRVALVPDTARQRRHEDPTSPHHFFGRSPCSTKQTDERDADTDTLPAFPHPDTRPPRKSALPPMRSETGAAVERWPAKSAPPPEIQRVRVRCAGHNEKEKQGLPGKAPRK